jgi:hypothetical protein
MNIQIAEFKFDAELTFFEVRSHIGKPLKKLFKDWQFDAASLKLFDIDRLHSSILECKRISITAVNKKSDEFKDLVNDVASAYFKVIPVKSLKRYGFRKIDAIPLDVNFSEAVKLFQQRIYPQDKNFLEIFPKQFSDAGFVGDFLTKDFKYHFASGPTTKEESLIRFKPENPFVIKDDKKLYLNNTNLFIDIDCYQENILNQDYSKLIEKSIVSVEELSNKFFGYIMK